jgi:uncharacterized phage-associated protein
METKMATAIDVAEYFLKTYGDMSAWKLQKLVYYAQAWNLVWYDAPLFEEPIQAWANGPVVMGLYKQHRGEFIVETVGGDLSAVTDTEINTINIIYKHYGPQTAGYLSQLTHLEQPWIIARLGVPDGARSTKEITQASMHEYYASL